MTPFAFVRDERLERARNLLAKTRRSISIIAHETGFSSQFQLTIAFRSVYGMIPDQARVTH